MASNDPAAPRSTQLLDAAADALLDGSSPFAHGFLVEHHVTAAECHSLTETFGVLAKAYVRASPDLRALVIALGATHDTPIDPRFLEASIRGHQAMKALKRL
ncbi:MAG TPA: hypothetical protein VH208_01060 [Myxococcaceae bacterium]|jgi:hypothetical protein|nr:hypothetical protein [Myxococcaceae bacterium]